MPKAPVSAATPTSTAKRLIPFALFSLMIVTFSKRRMGVLRAEDGWFCPHPLPRPRRPSTGP